MISLSRRSVTSSRWDIPSCRRCMTVCVEHWRPGQPFLRARPDLGPEHRTAFDQIPVMDRRQCPGVEPALLPIPEFREDVLSVGTRSRAIAVNHPGAGSGESRPPCRLLIDDPLHHRLIFDDALPILGRPDRAERPRLIGPVSSDLYAEFIVFNSPPPVSVCPRVCQIVPRKLYGRIVGARIGGNAGAGEGNRTPVVSLGSFCSTIELHPRLAR